MDSALVGVIIGAAVSLVGSLFAPIITHRYSEKRQIRAQKVAEIRALIPQILVVVADNIEHPREGNRVPASAKEIELVSRLDMTIEARDIEISQIVKLVTSSARGDEPIKAEAALVVAMTLFAEWSQTLSAKGLTAAYLRSIQEQDLLQEIQKKRNAAE
jgi:hypothetical protein